MLERYEKDRDFLKLLLDILFSEERRLLLKLIEDIKGDMGERKRIAADTIKEIEGSEQEIYPLLKEMEQWSPGYKPSIDARKSELEEQLFSLRKEKRHQILSEWRNNAELKKELRKLLLEYEKALKLERLLKLLKEDEY